MKSKKIVIMGATSGIGLAVAERLAAKGYRIGAAGRNEEALRRLAAKYPGMVVWHQIDVTRTECVTGLRKLIDKLGGMDVYFHVSGVYYPNPALDHTLDAATVRTNVWGFTQMVDAAFCYFRDEHRGRGRIAAVTSVAGTKGIGPMASYSASKRFQNTYLTALDQLARSQGLKIRVTDIRPGWVSTPLLEAGQKYPMLMPLDYAARKVTRAVRRGGRVAYVDWRWRLLVGLWRLVPDPIWVRINPAGFVPTEEPR
ncbi:MAG: SDR family NAD(P)-dependent oxidoreductase [Duncaniella sp.]|nr:SDR family NAD(P)-dependent oxidoreductase [Duncaniella sp.]